MSKGAIADAGRPRGAGGTPGSGSVEPAVNLPAAKEFTFNVEGNEEKRTAKLVTADGYSMYVFDGFTFAAPISMLTMDIDPIYYARIEKLPAGYKLDEIEKEAETELAKVGKVQEAAGAGISPLRAALHS